MRGHEPPPLAVLCALEVEAKATRRALGPRAPAARDSTGAPLLLCVTGPGLDRAYRRASDFLRSTGARGLLVIGFGGGLDPDLVSGDILLAEEVTLAGEEDRSSWRPASDWLDRARRLRPPGFRIHAGRLVTAPGLVTTPEEKGRLARRTGARVVDMETAGMARAAAELARPALFARCVLDEAREILPPPLARLVTREGRSRPGRAGLELARRPWLLPHLLALGRRCWRGGRHLAWLVEAIALSGPQEP